MKLTFEQIRKKCEPMKHLLVSIDGDEFLYIGFGRQGQLITDDCNGEFSEAWDEGHIKDWTIKEYKPTRKVSFWDEYDKYYLNESVCLLDELRKQHPDLEIEVTDG